MWKKQRNRPSKLCTDSDTMFTAMADGQGHCAIQNKMWVHMKSQAAGYGVCYLWTKSLSHCGGSSCFYVKTMWLYTCSSHVTYNVISHMTRPMTGYHLLQKYNNRVFLLILNKYPVCKCSILHWSKTCMCKGISVVGIILISLGLVYKHGRPFCFPINSVLYSTHLYNVWVYT